MRLHTFLVMVVTPLLVVVGGVILLTPKDILRQPILPFSTAEAAQPATEPAENIAVVEPVEIAATEGETPRVVPASVEEEPASEQQLVRWITARSLNMRTAPSTAGDLVVSLPFGTPVTVVELTDGWAHVTAPDGRDGWMSTSFLADADPAL